MGVGIQGDIDDSNSSSAQRVATDLNGDSAADGGRTIRETSRSGSRSPALRVDIGRQRRLTWRGREQARRGPRFGRRFDEGLSAKTSESFSMKAGRSKDRRRRLPLGLLLMLALSSAFEAFIGRHEIDAVAPEDWQYLWARREAARKAAGCDLLVFGDSQAKFGILPKVLATRSRLRSYNLAISGAQPQTSHHLLRLALEGGAEPSAVLVDFNPFVLAKPPRAGRDGLSFLLGWGDSLRLSAAARDPVLFAELAARRILASLRCRSGLRQWMSAALRGRTNRYRLLMPEVFDHWARNDGALVVPSIPGRPVAGDDHQRRLYPRGWTPDRTNAAYVARFLQLADSRGMTVYWLIPPLHPALQSANEAAGFDRRYLSFVRAQQRRFPRLVVIDGRRAGYEAGVFLDPDHLGREGAFALSQDIGDLLGDPNRALTQGRWISLPPYRPRPTDPSILSARLDVFLPEAASSVTR